MDTRPSPTPPHPTTAPPLPTAPLPCSPAPGDARAQGQRFLRVLWQRLYQASRLDRIAGQCAICQTWQHEVFCPACLACFAAPVPRCIQCGIEVRPGQRLCGACLRRPPPYSRTLTALPYDAPWHRLIAALKFHGQAGLAPAFAQLLARHIRQSPPTPPPDWLLPMPMTDRRLAERGIHHTWMLTRALGRELQLPASPKGLRRIIDTPPQASLSRADRLHNVRRAFAVPPDWVPRLSGARVVVVDDVMTTGASLEACARTLRAAGVLDVQAWVLARTPRDG